MKTEREAALGLVRAIDSAGTPHAPFVQLNNLLKHWRQPPVGDKTRIGAGTHAALVHLCRAQEMYEQAIDDARSLLEGLR